MSDTPRRLARDLAEHLRFLAESGVEGAPPARGAAGPPPTVAAGDPAGVPPEADVHAYSTPSLCVDPRIRRSMLIATIATNAVRRFPRG